MTSCTNCTVNSFSEERHSVFLNAVSWSFICIAVLTCASNIIVIVTTLGTKSLRTISSAFLLNLAFSDLFIGLVMMPIVANSLRSEDWTLGKEACVVIGIWNHLLLTSSTYTITGISVDRYITIIHCLKYSAWSQAKYASIVLAVIWFSSFITTLASFADIFAPMEFDDTRYMCFPNWRGKLDTVIVFTFFQYIIPIFLMFFCYSKIISVARGHARKISDMTKQINQNIEIREKNIFGQRLIEPVNKISMISCLAGHSAHTLPRAFNQISYTMSRKSLTRFEREARAAVRLIGLAASFMFCWTPYTVINCMLSYGNTTIPKWCLLISVVFVYMSSALNPFLYALMSKRFRFAVKRLFRRCINQLLHDDVVRKLSDARSEHVMQTVSGIVARRTQYRRAVKEQGRIIEENSTSAAFSQDVIQLPGVPTCNNETSKKETKAKFNRTGNKLEAETQNIYLSVPKKSFTNGRGSLRIETIEQEGTTERNISTKIIHVDEYGPNNSEYRTDNTKIRICVDLTP